MRFLIQEIRYDISKKLRERIYLNYSNRLAFELVYDNIASNIDITSLFDL